MFFAAFFGAQRNPSVPMNNDSPGHLPLRKRGEKAESNAGEIEMCILKDLLLSRTRFSSMLRFRFEMELASLYFVLVHCFHN